MSASDAQPFGKGKAAICTQPVAIPLLASGELRRRWASWAVGLHVGDPVACHGKNRIATTEFVAGVFRHQAFGDQGAAVAEISASLACDKVIPVLAPFAERIEPERVLEDLQLVVHLAAAEGVGEVEVHERLLVGENLMLPGPIHGFRNAYAVFAAADNRSSRRSRSMGRDCGQAGVSFTSPIKVALRCGRALCQYGRVRFGLRRYGLSCLWRTLTSPSHRGSGSRSP